MTRFSVWPSLAMLALVGAGPCGSPEPKFAELPVETRFAFTNFSIRYYAAFGVRERAQGQVSGDFVRTPLLAPGATYRVAVRDLIGSACPASLDFQLFLYRRLNDGQDPPIPIGLDEGEQVEALPIVAGQIEDIPGPCAGFEVTGVYTVVNWEAPAGQARVKFAQTSLVEAIIRQSNRFPNRDAAWEIGGVEPGFANVPSPPPLAMGPIAGRVTLKDGTGVAGIGVVLRTSFHVRLDDSDPSNDPDSGFSDPIDYTITDASGAFSFSRPAGVYQVEFFSDDFAFRPPTVDIESPLETVWVLVEPL